MFEVDRITPVGMRSIVGLLRHSMEIEYAFIVNYPRLIDQLVNIDRSRDEQIIKQIESLGKRSVQHLGWTATMIKDLGGEPLWEIGVIDRMVDVAAMFQAQAKKEEEALSQFQLTKKVAEQNQVKGLLTKIKAVLGDVISNETVSRSSIIRLLEQLVREEQAHVGMAQMLILELNLQTEK